MFQNFGGGLKCRFVENFQISTVRASQRQNVHFSNQDPLPCTVPQSYLSRYISRTCSGCWVASFQIQDTVAVGYFHRCVDVVCVSIHRAMDGTMFVFPAVQSQVL